MAGAGKGADHVPDIALGIHLRPKEFLATLRVFWQGAIHKSVGRFRIVALENSAGIDPPEAEDPHHHGDQCTRCLAGGMRMDHCPVGKVNPAIQRGFGGGKDGLAPSKMCAVMIDDESAARGVGDAAAVSVAERCRCPQGELLLNPSGFWAMQGKHGACDQSIVLILAAMALPSEACAAASRWMPSTGLGVA